MLSSKCGFATLLKPLRGAGWAQPNPGVPLKNKLIHRRATELTQGEQVAGFAPRNLANSVPRR